MTYEEILQKMQNEFEELTGMEADRASDIGIRLKLLAGQLAGLEVRIDYLLRQALPQTADGKYLDMHAALRGMQRRKASCAQGTLSFSRTMQTETDIIIPKGTVCSTGEVQDIRFETLETAVLPKGGRLIDVPAQALESGKSGSVAAGAVSVMITPPQGIEEVTNTAAFRGGEDIEDDASLRARLLESYRRVSNGANKAFYRNAALSDKDVTEAAVLPRVRGNGTVDVVIYCGSNGDYSDVIPRVQADLQEKSEIGVDVLVRRAILAPIMVDIDVEIADGYTYQQVGTQISKTLIAFGEDMAIGEKLRLCDIHKCVLSCEGIDNYKIVSPLQDTEISGDEIALPRLHILNQI